MNHPDIRVFVNATGVDVAAGSILRLVPNRDRAAADDAGLSSGDA